MAVSRLNLHSWLLVLYFSLFREHEIWNTIGLIEEFSFLISAGQSECIILLFVFAKLSKTIKIRHIRVRSSAHGKCYL